MKTAFPEAVDPRPGIFHGWWIVAAVAVTLSVSVTTVVINSFSVFLRPLGDTFGWTRGQISAALALAGIGTAIGAPLTGMIADRWGARGPILASISAVSLCLMSLFALTSRIEHLYAIYALTGLICLGSTPLLFSRIIANWFDRGRGLALGLATTGIGIGSLFVPVLAQGLIANFGWRWAYLWLGAAIALVGLPVTALVIRESPGGMGLHPDGRTPAAPGKPPLERNFGDALRTRAFWQMLAVFFTVSACLNGCLSQMAALLGDRGESAANAALAISLFGGASLVGRVATGWLVDRFAAPLVAGAFFALSGLALASLWQGAGGPAAYLSAFGLGLGMGAEADVMPYMVSRYFGFQAMNRLFGLIFGAFTLGAAAGPAIMGAGFDRTGSYAWPLGWLTLAMAIAIAGVLTLPKMRPAETRF
ncbi:MAG: MFS transporter [Bryobacteraceae bacterium]|nr:MFS transporter [Bryobacteraceae bacterium]